MKKNDSNLCPAARMLDLLGQRHVLVIIHALSNQPTGFNDLQESLNINTATLTDRLSMLEEEKVIEKKICEKDSRRHYYSLTARGKKLSALIGRIGKV